jgi:dephospho-CoA kinase
MTAARFHDSQVPVIGLLGGVASGKSAVARLFEELGAKTLDADKAGHEVLRREDVKAAVRETWGDEVFSAHGEVDRPKLGRIVFADQAALVELERLTHPHIGDLLRRRAAELAAAGARAIILDAAVMLKAGWDKLCDVLVFVDAPREARLGRAARRGWSESDFDRREAAQEPVEHKRQLCQHVIDNSGPLEQTRAQVAHVWQQAVGKTDDRD